MRFIFLLLIFSSFAFVRNATDLESTKSFLIKKLAKNQTTRISREIVKKSHKLIVLKGKNAQDEVNKLPKEMIYKYRLEKSISNNELGILIVEVMKKSE